MSLSAVYLTSDLYMACLQLALSTEKEEVMGMLIGESDESDEGEVVNISDLMIPRRSEKKKDRVEISSQQLVAASEYAQLLSEELGCEKRVIGWYHSHPHITVCPSHVDVNTQATYQMMDKGFVGIICSLFSEDKATKECEVQLTCFQSVNSNRDGESNKYERVEVPLHIEATPSFSNSCLRTISTLQDILQREELDSYRSIKTNKLDILSRIHNNFVLTKSLCHVTEVIAMPLLKALHKLEAINRHRCNRLANRPTTTKRHPVSDTTQHNHANR